MSVIGGINLGSLTDFLFFFANGYKEANWQSASKGFLGNAAINGITALEKTSGSFGYAGTISTNDTTLSDWQTIVNNNLGQAFSSLGQTSLITALNNDLVSAIHQINALSPTPGFESVSINDLNGLNTQNGISEVYVINITSDLSFTSKINITGDAGDVFILRWDTDGNPLNGYQGQLKPHSGGAIVPLGGLKPTNFISVAGDITSSGGGTNPPAPYPQGPRYNDGTGALITNGQNWNGGGFFTGYLLTTGAPGTTPDSVTGLYIGDTSPLSNGIFVGGWYSLTTKFSMTSGTSGVYITPNPATYCTAKIDVKKYVSANNGVTWDDAESAPGPNISSNVQPQFKFVITNTGNVTLTNISLVDSVYGIIPLSITTLPAGGSVTTVIIKPWSEGPHENKAIVTGVYGSITVTSFDYSHYFGIQVEVPHVNLQKYLSTDDGATWIVSETPPGVDVPSTVIPQFKFVVTNTGNEELTGIVITDDKYGVVGELDILQLGESEFFLFTAPWEEGQHLNTATVTDDQLVTDSSSVYYNGVVAQPAIDVTKYVSADNGATWVEAHTAPGPVIFDDIVPQFKFVVTNTGDLPLSFVSLSDSVYGPITVGGTLAPGAWFDSVISLPWQEGLHENIALVTASYADQPLRAVDNAFYTGEFLVSPDISVIKNISVDGGLTWVHADTKPGPLLPAGMTPMFQYIITNTGSTPLENVTAIDDVLGVIVSGITLAVGEILTIVL